MWPRWLAHFCAFLGGYFWLPCPNCKRMFAGFEVGQGYIHTDRPGIFNACCRWCPEGCLDAGCDKTQMPCSTLKALFSDD